MDSIKQARFFSKMSDVASGMRVETWLRPYVLVAIFSMRLLPKADLAYLEALEQLDSNTRRAFLLALSSARSRADANCDIMGVVAIPLFLGVFTILSTIDTSFAAIWYYGAALCAYAFIYFYHRIQKAAIVSFADAVEVDVITSMEDETRQGGPSSGRDRSFIRRA